MTICIEKCVSSLKMKSRYRNHHEAGFAAAFTTQGRRDYAAVVCGACSVVSMEKSRLLIVVAQRQVMARHSNYTQLNGHINDDANSSAN